MLEGNSHNFWQAQKSKAAAYYYIFVSNSLFMTAMMCVCSIVVVLPSRPSPSFCVECLFLYLLFLLVTFAFHHVMWEYELYEGGYKKQGQPSSFSLQALVFLMQ